MEPKEMFCSKKYELSAEFGYYMYLPKNYAVKGQEKWPLIVFLHGAGERGNGKEELGRIKINGLPKVLEENQDFPFIVLAPQCPENTFWAGQIEKLNCLVDDIIRDYYVDENRVYLTGMSMGGYGTWYYAMAYPKKFAAIAPICGGGMAWNAEVLKDIPIWAFHGEKDTVVSINESKNMVDALKKCKGNVRFTTYPEADHDSWTETYNNQKLYKWFLDNKKATI